ncbi:hypothetical protein IWX90DRAFT_495563 [Phyllosticta citrichinensis]|uniref:Uncharacterized protein n=1 Tax=Phyllosticta citrichinensis TaxID=1130410 RepID=A0ABR1XFU5_9PEZI
MRLQSRSIRWNVFVSMAVGYTGQPFANCATGWFSLQMQRLRRGLSTTSYFSGWVGEDDSRVVIICEGHRPYEARIVAMAFLILPCVYQGLLCLSGSIKMEKQPESPKCKAVGFARLVQPQLLKKQSHNSRRMTKKRILLSAKDFVELSKFEKTLEVDDLRPRPNLTPIFGPIRKLGSPLRLLLTATPSL